MLVRRPNERTGGKYSVSLRVDALMLRAAGRRQTRMLRDRLVCASLLRPIGAAASSATSAVDRSITAKRSGCLQLAKPAVRRSNGSRDEAPAPSNRVGQARWPGEVPTNPCQAISGGSFSHSSTLRCNNLSSRMCASTTMQRIEEAQRQRHPARSYARRVSDLAVLAATVRACSCGTHLARVFSIFIWFDVRTNMVHAAR